MEYYILKCYQKAKQKCPEVEQGFGRFDPRTKKIVITSFIIMLISFVEIAVTLLLFPKQLWHFIGIVTYVIAVLVIFEIDNKDQKIHMDKYVDSHKKKIGILEDVLAVEFNINTKEKVEELINIYQEYVDKRKEAEKRRKGIILTILSAFAGVLTISFENMGVIGIDFDNWVYLAIILLFVVAVASIGIYSYTFFDSLKGKYEMMIKDLKDFLLMKF